MIGKTETERAARAALLKQAIAALKIALAQYESELIRLTTEREKQNNENKTEIQTAGRQIEIESDAAARIQIEAASVGGNRDAVGVESD